MALPENLTFFRCGSSFSRRAVTPPVLARDDWKIIRALSEVKPESFCFICLLWPLFQAFSFVHKKTEQAKILRRKTEFTWSIFEV